MSVKISSLQIENVKRVKAVAMEPAADGLTVIGGRNNQGKTSVLDAIAWALGGGKHKPSEPKREGSATEPALKVELSNGLIVERKGKNGDLKVIDPAGRKSGQALLDGFVEQLAIDLSRFLESSSKEKAQTLLNIIGVGDQLAALEQQEQTIYNQRLTIGQMEKVKRGAAEDMTTYPDAPAEPVSATGLIKAQQTILAKNGENQKLRESVGQVEAELQSAKAEERRLEAESVRLKAAWDEILGRLAGQAMQISKLESNLDTARKTAEQLQDESTAEIEAKLQEIDTINAKVRTNAAKAMAEKEADELKGQYDDLSGRIDQVRDQRLALLDGADLPLPGLSVKDGELVYNGCKWDAMSGSDQLKVATAIVRKLKPECGFVLLDKLEQMDVQTMQEFGAWATGEGLQVIATRVSTGDECSIVIEDGYGGQVAEPEPTAAMAAGYADAPTLQPVMAPATEPSKWVM